MRLRAGGRITKRAGEQAFGGMGRSTAISSKTRFAPRSLRVATPDMARRGRGCVGGWSVVVVGWGRCGRVVVMVFIYGVDSVVGGKVVGGCERWRDVVGFGVGR